MEKWNSQAKLLYAGVHPWALRYLMREAPFIEKPLLLFTDGTFRETWKLCGILSFSTTYKRSWHSLFNKYQRSLIVQDVNRKTQFFPVLSIFCSNSHNGPYATASSTMRFILTAFFLDASQNDCNDDTEIWCTCLIYSKWFFATFNHLMGCEPALSQRS